MISFPALLHRELKHRPKKSETVNHRSGIFFSDGNFQNLYLKLK